MTYNVFGGTLSLPQSINQSAFYTTLLSDFTLTLHSVPLEN